MAALQRIALDEPLHGIAHALEILLGLGTLSPCVRLVVASRF